LRISSKDDSEGDGQFEHEKFPTTCGVLISPSITYSSALSEPSSIEKRMQSRTLSERIRTGSIRFLGGFIKVALPKGIGVVGKPRFFIDEYFKKSN